MTMSRRPVTAVHRSTGHTPTGDAADRWLREPTAEAVDRWLRGRSLPTPPQAHLPEAGLTPRQLRALHLAPCIVSTLPRTAPAEERWRRFTCLPADVRQVRTGGRIPQGLNIALPEHTGAAVRCLYRLVVIDDEVVLVPAIVRVSALQFRAFGGRETYAPDSVPPAFRPAYEAVWGTLQQLQAHLDRRRGEEGGAALSPGSTD